MRKTLFLTSLAAGLLPLAGAATYNELSKALCDDTNHVIYDGKGNFAVQSPADNTVELTLDLNSMLSYANSNDYKSGTPLMLWDADVMDYGLTDVADTNEATGSRKPAITGWCAGKIWPNGGKIEYDTLKKYADATHNVYAYILGDGLVSRYSDDAEPQGTAGMPVLNAIRMSGITDVCVIVTRYFGGILLGAGGLVRAYSTSASMALEKGGIAIYEEYDVIECECSYSDYQKLQPILEHQNVKLDTTEFLENITLKFSIPCEESLTLSKKIQDTFAGRIKLNFVEKRLDCR